MFRDLTADYTERVDIIGNQKFLDFVDDLEKLEDLKLETFELGKDPVRILTIMPLAERKEFDIGLPMLTPTLVRKKSLEPRTRSKVADILEHDLATTIQYWDAELTHIRLNFEDRTGHLPGILADLIYRLRLPMETKVEISIAAREHGDLRRKQGYTAAMVVEESRILQVSIFNTLQNNLARVDFSKVLLDVMTIADEVDSQLKQAMLSYVEPTTPSWAAADR